MNSRNGRVSGRPTRAQKAARSRVTCLTNHLSNSCAPVVAIFCARNVVVLLRLALLRLVPDDHEIGLDAHQALVGQIVPARDADRRADAARTRRLDASRPDRTRRRPAATPAARPVPARAGSRRSAGAPEWRCSAAIEATLERRARRAGGSRGIAIEPVIGRRQHLPLHARAQRRSPREPRMEVADEIHDAAQPYAISPHMPSSVGTSPSTRTRSAIGAQPSSPTGFLMLVLLYGDRHVVAAGRALFDRRVVEPQILRRVPDEQHLHGAFDEAAGQRQAQQPAAAATSSGTSDGAAEPLEDVLRHLQVMRLERRLRIEGQRGDAAERRQVRIAAVGADEGARAGDHGRLHGEISDGATCARRSP